MLSPTLVSAGTGNDAMMVETESIALVDMMLEVWCGLVLVRLCLL